MVHSRAKDKDLGSTEVEAQVRAAGATGNGGESGRAEKRRKTGGASVRLGGGGKPGRGARVAGPVASGKQRYARCTQVRSQAINRHYCPPHRAGAMAVGYL